MQITNPSPTVPDASQTKSSTEPLPQNRIYSATVEGRTYSANVEVSDGQYVATIPSLPGISASGTTRQAAEADLSAKVSLLV